MAKWLICSTSDKKRNLKYVVQVFYLLTSTQQKFSTIRLICTAARIYIYYTQCSLKETLESPANHIRSIRLKSFITGPCVVSIFQHSNNHTRVHVIIAYVNLLQRYRWERSTNGSHHMANNLIELLALMFNGQHVSFCI